MKRKPIVTTSTYQGYPIQLNQACVPLYDTRHLDNNLKLLQSMTVRHNKVLCFKMTISFPAGIPLSPQDASNIISRFFNSFMSNLNRKGLDPTYAMRMQQLNTETPTFICYLLVDGQLVKTPDDIIATAYDLYAIQLEENVADLITLSSPYHTIIKSSKYYQTQFNLCYMDLSEIAINNSTDLIPAGTRKVFYSRLNC